jgi:hypothetical protein
LPVEPPLDTLADSLESTLADLTRAHAELLEMVREHRRAISRSDAAAIQNCLSSQGLLAMRLTDLERTRRQIVAQITGKPTSPFTEVAPRLPEPSRSRISAASERLRALLGTIQRENNIVRTATHTLIAHIDGLMQQVARALSHAGVYGRQGRVEAAGPVPCGLDMTH